MSKFVILATERIHPLLTAFLRQEGVRWKVAYDEMGPVIAFEVPTRRADAFGRAMSAYLEPRLPDGYGWNVKYYTKDDVYQILFMKSSYGPRGGGGRKRKVRKGRN